MDSLEAVLRHLRLVARMLDVLASEAVGFSVACLHLLLDGQRRL